MEVSLCSRITQRNFCTAQNHAFKISLCKEGWIVWTHDGGVQATHELGLFLLLLVSHRARAAGRGVRTTDVPLIVVSSGNISIRRLRECAKMCLLTSGSCLGDAWGLAPRRSASDLPPADRTAAGHHLSRPLPIQGLAVLCRQWLRVLSLIGCPAASISGPLAHLWPAPQELPGCGGCCRGPGSRARPPQSPGEGLASLAHIWGT